MNDKQEQVEEITNIIMTLQTIYHENASSEQIAQGLVNANCRIVEQGSVVLSKEEYEDLRMLETKYGLPTCMDGCITAYGHRLMTGERLVDQARKQVVKEVLELLDEMRVKEDDRHQWRENHNDCIRKCKVKIAKEFGVEVE